MWPGGQRSDARTRGARLVTVGTRAPLLPDVRAARAVSVWVHGLYEEMRACPVSVCMMWASTSQAQAKVVFPIHGANEAEASATAEEPDVATGRSARKTAVFAPSVHHKSAWESLQRSHHTD